MEQLPPHVATANEPIPSIRGDRFDGPDLRTAPPIAEIVEGLDRFAADGDVVGYVERFRKILDVVGIDVSLMIERDGDEYLMAGSRCDAQMRHRSRWIHFLFEHLDRDEERRTYLMLALRREGRMADNRPSNPRATTIAVRNYLRHEGRILIDPDGHLTEGGGIPDAFATGGVVESANCRRAHWTYFDARRRWRRDRQIKRAVRLLGKRTANGWYVLEARQ